jgi:hypothetical protein
MAELDLGNGNVFDSANGAIQQSDHERNLALAIEMRENEVYQYQLNINNYSAMLQACIQEPWPQRLLPYRGMTRDQLAQSIQDDDDLDLAGQLAFRDELRLRVRSEKMECSKAKMMLAISVASATDIAKIRAIIVEIKASRASA